MRASATTHDDTLSARVRAALTARPGRGEQWVTDQLPAGASWAPWSAPWTAAAAALLELEPETPAKLILHAGGRVEYSDADQTPQDATTVFALSQDDLDAITADRRAAS